MLFSYIIHAFVAISFSMSLVGCGGGGGTTTFTTTWFDSHVKWVNSDLDEREAGMGASVGADGTVFIPAGDSLCALDGDAGVLKWKYKLGNKSIGVPAVGKDGSVYLLTGEFYMDFAVQAVNGNGTEKWVQDFNMFKTEHHPVLSLGSTIGRNSVVLGSDGTVFGCRHSSVMREDGYISNLTSSLFALDAGDGSIKWQLALGGRYGAPQSPVVAPDDTIFMTDVAGHVLAVRGADGSVKWNASIAVDHDVMFSSPSLGANGTVLVCSGEGLFALNREDGTVKWRQWDACLVQVMQYPGPAVDSDGTIFVEARNDTFDTSDVPNRTLLALRGDDGSTKWSYHASRDAHQYGETLTTAAVSTDGTVYFGYAESVYALNAETGSVRWSSTSLRGMFNQDEGPPVIGPDGMVIVSALTTVVALRGEAVSATLPYVSSLAQGERLV